MIASCQMLLPMVIRTRLANCPYFPKDPGSTSSRGNHYKFLFARCSVTAILWILCDCFYTYTYSVLFFLPLSVSLLGLWSAVRSTQ